MRPPPPPPPGPPGLPEESPPFPPCTLRPPTTVPPVVTTRRIVPPAPPPLPPPLREAAPGSPSARIFPTTPIERVTMKTTPALTLLPLLIVSESRTRNATTPPLAPSHLLSETLPPFSTTTVVNCGSVQAIARERPRDE